VSRKLQSNPDRPHHNAILLLLIFAHTDSSEIHQREFSHPSGTKQIMVATNFSQRPLYWEKYE
jgi:hypothetical protein